jgi:tetratricopeptide (TPR) repeat protein
MFGVMALARIATAQPGPLPAAELARQGTDLYTAGNYADAVSPLQRAVELEPNNADYQFTLAQALRQSGQCDKATPIYRGLAAAAVEPRKAEIDAGIAACTPSITPQPQTPAPMVAPEPALARSAGSASRGNIAMLMGGGVALGAGIVLLYSGYTHSGDAEAARTVKDHDRIAGRATAEYVLGGIGIAAGVALSALAAYRLSASDEHSTAVAFTPRSGGGSVVLEGSW